MTIKKIESPVGAGDSKENREKMNNLKSNSLYHDTGTVSTQKKKPNGVFLAFVIGIVAGLVIGVITATALNEAIHDFESNPHGAVQVMREAER